VAELALSVIAHAFLGVASALVVWALGLGLLRAVPLPRPAFAYPLGLLVAVAAAWLVLVSWWLAPVSVVLLAPAVLGLRAAMVAGAPVAPFAAGLGVALGGLLHGPTSDRGSHAYGDMLFYAAKLVSASSSVLPFRDLLVEGKTSTYAESGSTFLGAAVSWLPGFDAILFQAAAMPAFLVAAIGVGLRLSGVRVARAEVAFVLGLLGVGAIAYPTWITESPPVALALPLAFAVYTLAYDRLSLGAVAAGVVVLGLAFALTKGFGVVPLAVAATFAAARLRDEIDVRRVAVYAVAPVAVAAVGAALFFATSGWLADVLGLKFLPGDAFDGLRTQLDRRDTQAVAPALLVVGEVLLAWALARARAWPSFAILVAGIAGNWFVSGHGFDIAVGIGVLGALLFFATRPDAFRAQRWPLLGGGGALALAAAFRDISGVRAGLVLGLLLAGGVVAAVATPRVTAVAAAIVAAGVAGGLTLGRDDVGLANASTTLTSAHYAVWREVRERVPRDGLVFTTETGPEVTGDQGWNYYPGVAERQVYLAGWSSSPLLVDDAERARRLAVNRAVLAGGRRPESLDLSRRYGSYAAVVARGTPAAAGWKVLYRNELFTLYAIP
jgi:hypothetical protein